jgi:peptidoglycan-associated lipoprotein
MRSARVSWPTLKNVLFALAILASVACGPKRPPAVVTGGAGPAGGRELPTAGQSAEGTEPPDLGPEIQPIPNDLADRDDLAASATGEEGGPLADIQFDFDQAALTDAARATLVKHAAWLTAHPGVRVAVEGHCDERGTVEYNLALGDKRAQATRDHLVSLGVAAARLSAVSFGKERPLDASREEAAWARNRRAHFAVTR